MVQRFSTFPNPRSPFKNQLPGFKVRSVIFIFETSNMYLCLPHLPYFISIIAKMNIFDDQVPFKEWTEQVRHLVMHFLFCTSASVLLTVNFAIKPS